MFRLPSTARHRAGREARGPAGPCREPRERHRRPRASTCAPRPVSPRAPPPAPGIGAPHASCPGLRPPPPRRQLAPAAGARQEPGDHHGAPRQTGESPGYLRSPRGNADLALPGRSRPRPPLSPRLPSVKFPGRPQREAGRQEQPQGELHGRRELRWPPRQPRASGGGGGAPAAGRAGVRLPPRPAALPQLRSGGELGALPFPFPLLLPARPPGCQAEEARRGERQRRPIPAEAPAARPGPPPPARGTWRAWDTWGGRER